MSSSVGTALQQQQQQQQQQPADACSDARWFYARGRSWVTFDDADDARLERRFEQLGGTYGWRQREAARRQEEDDRRRQREERRERQRQQKQQQQRRVDGDEDDEDEDEEETATPVLRAPPSGIDKVFSLLPLGKDDKDKEQARADDDADEQPADSANKEKVITKGEKIIVHRIADPDDVAELQNDPQKAESDPVVPVLEDALFSVDLNLMELYPSFWKGTLLRVVRATWFYSSSDGSFAPIAWHEGLTTDLDRAYAENRPWERFPEDQKGEESDKDEEEQDDDETRFHPLPSMKNNGKVKFVARDLARIFSEDLKGRLLSLTGGALVVRGWAKAHQRAEEKNGADFFSSLRGFSLPWLDDSDSEDEDEEDGKSSRPSRKDRGKTFSAHRIGRREGAARTPRRNEADKRGESVPEEEQSSSSDAGWARLVPSADALLRPRYALYRLLGWTDAEARDETIRHEKDKATKSAVRGSSWWGLGGKAEDSDDSDDEEDEDEEDEETGPAEDEQDRSDEPPELILAIHGIGQALTDSFDAVDFTYDIEHLRTLCGKLSQGNKHIRRLARGKRVQFIPVCWRQGLSFDQHDIDGNDNFYTLSEVNAGASIPFVRNVISKVILDVPYYLSAHKQKMVDAARAELNRVYKLWCLRNPDFERKGGRVSIIGHSLGSALTTDILSEQPTEVPPLYTLSSEERKRNDRLLFNTRHAYLCGSPQGFFYYLNGGQMIARRGTARTKEGVWPEHATCAEPRYGCLAAESVYNCYDATDPVAFSLSATVDSFCASILHPVELQGELPKIQAQLEGPQLSIAKILQIPSMKEGNKLRLTAAKSEDLHAAYQAALDGENDEDVGTKIRRKLAKEALTESLVANEAQSEDDASARRAKAREATVELGETASFNRKAGGKGKGKERFDLAKLERGQARLNALNPHGRVDFVIPSDGLSEYLEMIGAHMSYWTSTAFATFILSQTFSEFTPGPPKDGDGKPGSGSGQTREQIKRRLTLTAQEQQQQRQRQQQQQQDRERTAA
ncbi:hypothetical protein OC834_006115 [Tilletia horrida]|nr:hypothetical protein OC834_006115 [Tilletia horrida]